MAYVFSGAYTPLSCKLVEQILYGGGVNTLDDVTRLLGTDMSTIRRPTSVRTRKYIG